MVTSKQPKGCLAALLGASAGPEKEMEEAPPDGPLPYQRKDYLVTKGERAFYDVLRAAVEGRYLICPKVGLKDLLFVRKGTDSWRKHFNRIQSKHIDFVLADTVTLRPLLAIELDDASHNRPHRQDRDAFIEKACEVAGLPILRVPAKSGYNPQDLARSIDAAI